MWKKMTIGSKLENSTNVFFYSAGARDKWSQLPIKETKIKLYNTLYTRKPNENPTSHSENPN